MDKNVVFNISYGLYILLAKENEKDNGCVINTLMQISDTPQICIVSVNKENYTHDIIKKTKKLNISILTNEANMDIFTRFGFQSGRENDKFEGLKGVKRAPNGILYLEEYANSYISGEVLEAYDFGTHTVFKIEIVDAKIISDAKSLTYTYYHENVKPKPESKSSDGWRCKICNYEHEGSELPADFVCPICKHGVADFERI